MNIRTKTVLFFILSILSTIGVFLMLGYAFTAGFTALTNLLLFIVVIAAIILWVFFYFFYDGYKESINPTKKRKGKGNRRARRRK